MRAKLLVLVFFVLWGFFAKTNLNLLAQNNDLVENDSIFCIRFNFNLKDTLIYFVESYDSIVVDFGKPLLKIRKELLRVICDSITRKFTFVLRFELLQFRAKEFQDTSEIEYEENKWVNRRVWVEIDSLGNRLNFWVDDSLNSASGTGGPFQPHLFFSLGEGCGKKEMTWLARATESLPENGVPVPILRHSMLFKLVGSLDTLGENVIRAEFVRTGQGSLKMISEKAEFSVKSVINSFGFIDYSPTKKVPIHLFTNVEQKLTFESPNEKSVGKHYTNTNYTLLDFKPGRVDKPKPAKKKKR